MLRAILQRLLHTVGRLEDLSATRTPRLQPLPGLMEPSLPQGMAPTLLIAALPSSIPGARPRKVASGRFPSFSFSPSPLCLLLPASCLLAGTFCSFLRLLIVNLLKPVGRGVHMRKLFFLFVFALGWLFSTPRLTLAAQQPSAAAGITGKWRVTADYYGTPLYFQLELKDEAGK